MEENVIEISDGKLRKNKSETKAPLKQDNMQMALAKELKNPQQAAKIIDIILNNRPKMVRTNLKRTRNKKAGAKEV